MKDTNELIQEKNNWNRKEVIDLITSVIYAQNSTINIYLYPDGTVSNIDNKSLNKWIEDNL